MTNSNINPQIQTSYDQDLISRYEKLEKAADKTIQSFSTLIDEISKLKQVSTGTDTKEKVSKLANDMNNSSVYLTNMISEQLKTIHQAINPNAILEEIQIKEENV